jgi:PAS domain S-box-containing protein
MRGRDAVVAKSALGDAVGADSTASVFIDHRGDLHRRKFTLQRRTAVRGVAFGYNAGRGYSLGIQMKSTEMFHAKPFPVEVVSEAKHRVDREELLPAQLAQAFSLSHIAAFGAALTGPILAAGLWTEVSHALIISWTSGLLGLYTVRQMLARSFHKASPGPSEILHWAKLYTVGAVAIGSWWGLAGVLLFPEHSVLHQSLLAIFIAGVTCAAAVHHASTTACFAVILVMLLPLAGRFLYQGDEVHVTVGVLILTYVSVLLLMAGRMYSINSESLTLRFANTDLVNSLREQSAELRDQITERIRLEEEIIISEEKYRQLAENVNDVFMLIRFGEPCSFIYVSPAYQKLIGRNVEELYKNPTEWLTDIHEKDRLSVAEFFQQFIREAGDFNHEFRMLGSGGSTRWVWATGFPIRDAQGGIYRLAVIARDITQRKLDEEKLANLVKEIKNFAYIVSHDFRAPLTNIKGFAGELEEVVNSVAPAILMGLSQMSEKERERAIEALEKDLPEALAFINSSVSKMDHLIDAILSLSRLERGELHFERLDMNLLTQEILNEFSRQLNRCNIKVDVGPLPETVGDRLAMEQVITNLLNNAIKFRDPNRPQEVKISGRRFPGETAFVVRDCGRGVEQIYLSQIFQAFHRGSIVDVQGEGMGLAYVRTLVRRHGGRIWCESTPGQGACFTFTVSDNLPKSGPG